MAAIKQVIVGQHVMEGAGVRICRTIGVSNTRVDPFLMLDELKLPVGQATAGFPSHPHRGMATCTIMLNGSMEHRDSIGNAGVISDGGVQWMEAARGIIHSEMPVATSDSEMLFGFQLWVNLPSKFKMNPPRYQDIPADKVPSVEISDGSGKVRVLAGEYNGTNGPIEVHHSCKILLLDVRLEKAGRFEVTLPRGWNCFSYVYAGSGAIADVSDARCQHAYILETSSGDPGDVLTVEAVDEETGMACLVIAGEPINEPIVQHGPFVMNTQEEIMQAFADYRSGMLVQDTKNLPVSSGHE